MAGLGLLPPLFDDESPPPPQAVKMAEQAKTNNVFLNILQPLFMENCYLNF